MAPSKKKPAPKPASKTAPKITPKVSAKAVADRAADPKGKAAHQMKLGLFTQANFSKFFNLTAPKDPKDKPAETNQPDPRNLETIDGGYDAVKES